MKFDTDGVYTLEYTATDDCGNTTTEERTVNVISYNTVLFTDGTFIINEKSTDRDANVALHGAVKNEYIPFDPNGDNNQKRYYFALAQYRPWHQASSSVRSVEIGSEIQPSYLDNWFSGFTACTNFDFHNLDTSEAVSMTRMFYSCSAVSSLDLSAIDTSSCREFNDMFNGCSSLNSLGVSNFNTSNATNMASMFEGCGNLTSLDLSNFNTDKLENIGGMFSNCSGLTTLDLSNFNTSLCTSFASLFLNCKALTSLDISGFDTGNVTGMSGMFQSCVKLASLDLSSFDTSKVTNMSYMFQDNYKLAKIIASSTFVTTNVTTDTNMFRSCNVLVGGAGTRWSSTRQTGKAYARIDNPPDAPGYFTAKTA